MSAPENQTTTTGATTTGAPTIEATVPGVTSTAPAEGLGGVLRAVPRAWRVPTVRRGFLGTLLMALGAFTPAYLPTSSPFWGLLHRLHLGGVVGTVLGTVLSVAGIGLMVDAWFRLRPQPANPGQVAAYSHVRHWAVLLIWSAPFLLAPPIFSQDAYSYAAQGWLVHSHINPYYAGPGVLPGAFADQVSWVWRYTPAPYGPLALQIGHLLDWASGYRPYLAACLSRVPALVGVALIGRYVPRIAVQMRINPAPVAWFSVLNPILVIDFIGGMHNDSLMVGLVVLAVWLAGLGRRGNRAWWILAALVVGVAATIKQPALLAVVAVPLVARPMRSWHPRELGITIARELAALALAVASFAGVSKLTGLDFGWYNAVGVPGSVTTASPSTTIGYALQGVFDLIHWDPSHHRWLAWAHTAGYGVAAVTIVVLVVKVAPRRPVTFLALGYLTVALCLPALHTWYVLWGGVLFPLARPRYRALRWAVWVTVLLLAYNAISMALRNGLITLGIAGLIGYVWSTWVHHQGMDAASRRVPDPTDAEAVASAAPVPSIQPMQPTGAMKPIEKEQP